MVVNGLYLVIITVCVLMLAYRLYGAWIAAKVLTLNQYRKTPAYEFEDGQDYVPTNKWVVFGHHFAAIAGAGPLVGPVIAAQFGFMPGLLWLLFGSVFAGAVHDMVVLVASIRHKGKSLAEIAKDEVSHTAGIAALWVMLLLLIVTEAGMAVVVANSLHNSPWGFFTVSMTIPAAIIVGIYAKYVRPGQIKEATVLGVVLILAAVVGGPYVRDNPALAPLFTYDLQQVEIMLGVYGFLASVLPIWLLLAPRDYLSTYMKIGTIVLLAVGIIIVAPEIRMPAFSQFLWGGGPVLSGSVFPIFSSPLPAAPSPASTASFPPAPRRRCWKMNGRRCRSATARCSRKPSFPSWLSSRRAASIRAIISPSTLPQTLSPSWACRCRICPPCPRWSAKT